MLLFLVNGCAWKRLRRLWTPVFISVRTGALQTTRRRCFGALFRTNACTLIMKPLGTRWNWTICRSSLPADAQRMDGSLRDRKSTRLNSRHQIISYAVFCLKKKNIDQAREFAQQSNMKLRNRSQCEHSQPLWPLRARDGFGFERSGAGEKGKQATRRVLRH